MQTDRHPCSRFPCSDLSLRIVSQSTIMLLQLSLSRAVELSASHVLKTRNKSRQRRKENEQPIDHSQS